MDYRRRCGHCFIFGRIVSNRCQSKNLAIFSRSEEGENKTKQEIYRYYSSASTRSSRFCFSLFSFFLVILNPFVPQTNSLNAHPGKNLLWKSVHPRIRRKWKQVILEYSPFNKDIVGYCLLPHPRMQEISTQVQKCVANNYRWKVLPVDQSKVDIEVTDVRIVAGW